MNTLCVGLRPHARRLAMAVALVVFTLVVTPALSGQAFLPANNVRTGNGPAAVAVGDLNGDGRPDFVVANSLDSTVSVLLNNGNGNFGPAVNYAVGAMDSTSRTGVAVADLNGDARPDIIVANNGESSISVLINNGNGTFKPAVNYTVGLNPAGVAV